MLALVRQDQMAKRHLRMLMTLVLLPAEQMYVGLQHVRQEVIQTGLQEQFERLLLYVDRQWLRVVGPERCSVFNERHRTNNALEGFYSNLYRRIGSRPAVWKFTGK